MKPFSQWFWVAVLVTLLATSCSEPRTTVLVDPFIGTGGHGHTFPGATLPFGMMQLSPDTRLEGWDGCSGYHYSDSIIYGFSHTHLSGTGVSDYGDILMMPMGNTAFFENGSHNGPQKGYASAFKKENESAGPGWYAVKLEDDQIDVNLSATTHCGLHTYGFSSKVGQIMIDLRHRDPVLASGLRVINDTEIQGYRHSDAWATNQKLFFVARFSQPMTKTTLKGEETNGKTTANGKAVQALLAFNTQENQEIKVRVGISAVDIDGAIKNLNAEAPSWNFDSLQNVASNLWENQLRKIEIEGGSVEQQRNFYTALYHTCIAPNTFSDVDGRYLGLDGKVHQSEDQQYTIFSLWDTYRATHPLFTLIEQKRSEAFIRTFLRMYKDGGRLPVWELAGNETDCMIGYHSVSVIADAYAKGLTDFDSKMALEAMLASANADHFGLSYYKEQGFIGAGDESESVSKTLEYAYDDWCIATYADAIGEAEIAQEFYQRAQNYKNLFDPKTGFFRAKMNGSWQEPFDPHEVNFNFTEANAWQYSLAVQQDIVNLIKIMGGKKAFEEHLDKLFTAETATTGRDQADITGLIGQYAHGNEPSHHMAWLYNYTDAPHKTQQRVRQILNEMYHAAPDGLSGNEDCGQMSAWYVMSAMGLYSVTPGLAEYMVSAPIFPSIKLNLENGKTFEILAPGTDEGKNYIQSVKLDGRPFESMAISHETIMKGGKLVFEMGEAPNPKWAGYEPQQANSEIKGAKILPTPYFVSQSQTFYDSIQIEIATISPGEIFYAIFYDTTAHHVWRIYEGPITLHHTARIESFLGMGISKTRSNKVVGEFFKVDSRREIELKTPYENQYAAGGAKALIDGLRGGPNFRTGRWQGYQNDFEGIVDLGEKTEISRVKIGFLQDIRSWIWMPKGIEVSFSKNGTTWTQPQIVSNTVADNDYEAQTQELAVELKKPQSWQYIRIKALNYGKCPEWHLGAGGQAWIFADEIAIE